MKGSQPRLQFSKAIEFPATGQWDAEARKGMLFKKIVMSVYSYLEERCLGKSHVCAICEERVGLRFMKLKRGVLIQSEGRVAWGIVLGFVILLFIYFFDIWT